MERFVIFGAALAWLLAQTLKTLIALVRQRRFSLSAALAGSGGMPSSHSAFVTGLSAAIYETNGISLVFVLSLALAILTIRDAVGVRHTVDQHAHALNQLLAAHHGTPATAAPPLAVNTGHHLREVVCGVGVGLLTVLLASNLPFFH
jgi:acid phosphatase family membrane protein YuiD